MSEHDTPEPPNETSERGGMAPAAPRERGGMAPAAPTPPTPPAPLPPTDGEPSEQAGTPPESTGDPRVDEALTRLSELDETPVQEHAPVVEEIHRALQDTLAEEEA